MTTGSKLCSFHKKSLTNCNSNSVTNTMWFTMHNNEHLFWSSKRNFYICTIKIWLLHFILSRKNKFQKLVQCTTTCKLKTISQLIKKFTNLHFSTVDFHQLSTILNLIPCVNGSVAWWLSQWTRIRCIHVWFPPSPTHISYWLQVIGIPSTLFPCFRKVPHNAWVYICKPLNRSVQH